MPDGAGWFEKHVVESLGRMERNLDALAAKVEYGEREVADIRERMAVVETKGMLGGAIAALIITPIAVAIIMEILR